MDLNCYPRPTLHDLNSFSPYTTDSTNEPRPSYNTHFLGPTSHHLVNEYLPDVLSAQYPIPPLNPVNASSLWDDRHQLSEERGSLANNVPTWTPVGQPLPSIHTPRRCQQTRFQGASESYIPTQTTQSDPIDGGGVTEAQVQAQALQPRTPCDLLTQVPYKSTTRQAKFTGSETVEFLVSGREGIRLTDALEGKGAGLEGRDDNALFRDDHTQIIIRLQPTGCRSWHSKLHTKDFTSKRRPISRGKLATGVAKSVKRFIDEKRTHARCGWRDIPLGNIFLARIVRVSVASWQPEVFVERSSVLPQVEASSSSSSNPRPGGP